MEKVRASRRYWVHPINTTEGLTPGFFYTLFKDLRNNDVKCFNLFRISLTNYTINSRIPN